jgi:TrmH family RNA methyltransferase
LDEGHVTDIRSRDNPLVVALKKLAQDPAAYRQQQAVWLEGDHLLRAALQRGMRPDTAVIADSAWADDDLRALALQCGRTVRLPDALLAAISGLASPPPIGARLALPTAPAIDPLAATVVLDRLQDAGNVGSILRSAAAFGLGQVLALKGTAGLWSPKVLRAGMGAHFGLRLVEGLGVDDLAALQVPLLATSSHATRVLGSIPLPRPCAWVLGHEGQGVDGALLQRCTATLRIPQPGGEESLNVAAAAAVCFYEASLSR